MVLVDLFCNYLIKDNILKNLDQRDVVNLSTVCTDFQYFKNELFRLNLYIQDKTDKEIKKIMNSLINYPKLKELTIKIYDYKCVTIFSVPSLELTRFELNAKRTPSNLNEFLNNLCETLVDLNLRIPIGCSISTFEFNKLTNLERLNLSRCELHGFNHALKKLKVIDLSHNDFQEIDFSNLGNLREINLSSNIINDIRRLDTINLTKIRILNLSHNHLSCVWLYAATLEELDVSHNLISSDDLYEIQNLYYLRKLNISNNRLTKLAFKETNVDHSSFLKFVNSEDHIGFSISVYRSFHRQKNPITFDPINLEELNVSDNRIEIISNIDVAINLRVLNLQNNFLRILPDEFCNLINLEELNLSNNSLCTLPVDFGNLTKLTKLYLDSNRLVFLQPSMEKLVNLETLELSFNENIELSSPIWYGLKKLKRLILIKCQIYIIPNSFGSLTNLETLYLSENYIKTLPKKDATDEHIEELNYGSNQTVMRAPNSHMIATFKTCEKDKFPTYHSFSELCNLVTLDLSDNYLEEIDDEICKLQKLVALNLDRNKICVIPKMKDLCNLQHLSIKRNNINVFPEVSVLPMSLKKINLFGNHISEIPSDLHLLKNLQFLDINSNNVSHNDMMKLRELISNIILNDK